MSQVCISGFGLWHTIYVTPPNLECFLTIHVGCLHLFMLIRDPVISIKHTEQWYFVNVMKEIHAVTNTRTCSCDA